MNTKYLTLKLGFVILLVVGAVLLIKFRGIQYGIDLRGGHSLTFEIRTNQREISTTEQQIAEANQQVAEAALRNDTAAVDSGKARVERLEQHLKELQSARADESTLPDRIIAILKQRIDPMGMLSLEWRAQQGSRIEIRMPAASPESIQAREAYQDALARVEQRNLQPSQVQRVLRASGDAREQAIRQIAGNDKVRSDLLHRMAELTDHRNALETKIETLTRGTTPGGKAVPSESVQRDLQTLRAEIDNDLPAIRQTTSQLNDTNISLITLRGILDRYLSRREIKAISNTPQTEARLADYRQKLTEFNKNIRAIYAADETSAQAVWAMIDDTVKKYERWQEVRRSLDDPADLKRMVAKAGVLEFRIAPTTDGPSALPAQLIDTYRRQLAEKGPEFSRARNEDIQWFPLAKGQKRSSFANLIVARWGADRDYVLLYNTPDKAMLHSAGGDWQLKSARPDVSDMGRPSVAFSLDTRGANIFSRLTGAHINWPMAILLDDDVYSAPNIRSAISSSGQITGDFTQQEVDDLVRTLNAGSLPARLNPEPVAESSFGPSLGMENLDLAKNAGMWSLIVVGAFMLIYYMLPGLVADVAMIVNLLFVIGVMSIFNAVLTLPGVAGVILTIGMAVDANVLIYERLREEQAKGQSIRQALKNAYERAFSAIIDSNLTTLMVSIILFWIATEEIKGFAVTLGLGVLFNLFTGVTFTRWAFSAMLQANLIQRPLPMMRVISVPTIQWMSKRYLFWGLSAITGIMGIASLVWQGNNIWGIDFSSGTQAIVRLKDDSVVIPSNGKQGQLPNDLIVEQLVKKVAADLGYQKLLDSVKVETRINRKHVQEMLERHFGDIQKFPNVLAQGRISADDWSKAELNAQAFDLMDTDHDKTLTRNELQADLPPDMYQLTTTESDPGKVRRVIAEAFGDNLVARTPRDFDLSKGVMDPQLKVALSSEGTTAITADVIRSADPSFRDILSDYEGGVLFVARNVRPAISASELRDRLRQMRFQPDFARMMNPFEVIPLASTATEASSAPAEDTSAFAVLVKPAESLAGVAQAWNEFVRNESNLLAAAFSRSDAIEMQNFDPAMASETALRAGWAMLLGWLGIIAYLWVRFGSWKWGFGAVICLVHDVMIIVGMVAVSGWLANTAVGRALGVGSFKIDLPMVAVLLTIIGYSVNDTIVVFDRIRENRGRLATVSPQIIDDSINQTLSRTLLTGTSTLAVVFIMYVWGGPGIHAFNYALLIGIVVGTYSSIAVAAPVLLGFKKAVGITLSE